MLSFKVLSNLTIVLPTLPSMRNSSRSPPISSLNPRISPSNVAPTSAPNPDSDSDFSFSFPFPFTATFLFFDDPASGPSFSAPTSQVFLMAWQDRHAVARGESLHRHSSPDFVHPTHTCPSLTLHLTPSSATTDPTVTSTDSSLPRFFPNPTFFPAFASSFLARRAS